ncbi:MAG: hemerythrin domain-containing protein [Syntrophorhabdales bacterium]
MMPIAPLMIEHRLIERTIKAMKGEVDLMNTTGRVRPEFIDKAVDFMRTYADRCHHGKEEDILFRLLSEKAVSDQYKETMEELKEEHVRAREMTARLVAAKDRYLVNRTALADVTGIIQEFVRFYPVHIEKEDRHFFIPCMAYFSTHEQDEMLQSFWEFDRMLIHEKYRSVVENLEGKG